MFSFRLFRIGLVTLLSSLPALAIAISDPTAATVPTGAASGVAWLGSCTGTLLSTGMHVLTAAHCVTGGATNVEFRNATGSPSYAVASTTTHPDFVGINLPSPANADIAVITLTMAVDPSITRYEIYRGGSETGSTFQLTGYGIPGNGATGMSGVSGTLRSGFNQFEGDAGTLANPAQFTPGAYLLYDFDNGLAAQNPLGGLGLGPNEALGLFGDSGAPLFLNLSGVLYIAGVQSFFGRDDAFDLNGILDGTHGEIGGATRVSTFQAFVDSTTGVPEPGTFVLGTLGLAVIGWRRMRQTRG